MQSRFISYPQVYNGIPKSSQGIMKLAASSFHCSDLGPRPGKFECDPPWIELIHFLVFISAYHCRFEEWLFFILTPAFTYYPPDCECWFQLPGLLDPETPQDVYTQTSPPVSRCSSLTWLSDCSSSLPRHSPESETDDHSSSSADSSTARDEPESGIGTASPPHPRHKREFASPRALVSLLNLYLSKLQYKSKMLFRFLYGHRLKFVCT